MPFALSSLAISPTSINSLYRYKPRNTRVLSSLLALTLFSVAGCSSSGGSDILETVGTDVPEADQRIISNEFARPYNSTGKYATVLKDCIVNDEDPCTLEILPYIGQEHPSPTISDIMDRVLVSHDWMGQRFEQALIAMPTDTLDLFVPITAVLIGSDVRPASYSRKYGRLKLDPKLLWLSNSEKKTISQAADYRDEFGNAIKFDSSWRMVKDGQYAWGSNSLNGTNERKLKDVLMPVSRVVYHETAHANDYIQKAIFASLDATDTPDTARMKNDDNRISDRLYDESLGISDNESWLFRFADTRWDDDALHDSLVDYTAVDAGAIMETEGKELFYGYLTYREDLATLFAHSMMRRHYGVETHFAFFDKPADEENASCNDYLIGWGVTNRAAADLVKVRSKWVMEQIMGESAAIDDFYQNIGFEGELPLGVAYCRSLDVQTASDFRNHGKAPTMKEVLAYEYSLFGTHHR